MTSYYILFYPKSISFTTFILSHSTRTRFCLQIAIRFVSQRNQCLLSFFQTFISIFCTAEEVRCENLSSSPTSSLPLSCTCPYQNVEVPVVLCVLTSLLSPVTFQTAGQLLGFSLGSSNVHPMATCLIISELGVPCSEQRRRRRED